MKGVLIRPLRLVRRLAAITLIAAALASCGAFGAIRDKAPEAVGAALGWCERAKDAVGEAAKDAIPKLGEAAKDALPIIKETVEERLVPAFAEAADEVRGLFAASDEQAASDETADEPPVLRRNADEPAASDGTADEPPVLRRNADSLERLALTFDDGPHPTLTAPILDLLAKYGVKATFFVIGENAEAHPELIERELAEGHEVANHTMTHAALSRLAYRDAVTQIMDAEHAIFPDGSGRSTLLRPPCGAVGQQTMRAAERLGMSIVLWSVDTRDWEHKSAEAIIRTVRGNVTGGDVILFHDFVSGESHTLEALETLIPELIDEGYEFVTVSEMFGLG